MKRALAFILLIVCVLELFGCGNKDAMPQTSDPVSEPIQNADTGNRNEEKIWSKQDVVSMFSRVKKSDWEYIDCVLIPDHASDRIGAVLFWDNQKQTSNVAFFGADGYFQQCGTRAKVSAEPEFTYLGNGKVTFQLETENAAVYSFAVTILIDGSNVNFEVENDLPE